MCGRVFGPVARELSVSFCARCALCVLLYVYVYQRRCVCVRCELLRVPRVAWRMARGARALFLVDSLSIYFCF